MKDERLVENLNKLNCWTEEQKQYIINHCYLEKIKDYLMKEYGGHMLSDPTVFKEFTSEFGESEDYNSTLHFTIHYKRERFPGEDCVTFKVNYQFSVTKKDCIVWETFDAYRKSDNVYLQGGITDKKYPIAYREEYTRSWQEGGFRYVYTYPEEER